MPTSGQGLTTVKMDLDHYTGTVKFQAADTYESIWYDVTESWEFLNETSSQHFNVVGFHPLIRACFNNSLGFGASATAQVTDGVVTGITVNNSGQGYVAPPKVQILGNGSGAEAIVTSVGNGAIGAIQVVNGGSGYLPLQYQGTIAATVLITTGYITNLQYR
jgi:hypothetical protein